MLVDLQLAKDLYFAFSRTVPGQFSVSVIDNADIVRDACLAEVAALHPPRDAKEMPPERSDQF
jgi:hypothetical protein